MLSASQHAQILAILNAGADFTLATLRPDGWPQATTVSYVHDGLALYFGTGAASQKAQNLARDDRVSLTIDLPYAAWSEIRGLSLGGRARRVTAPEERAKVGALMLAKFPQIKQFEDFGAGMDLALFRIDPEAVSILDYAQGFGHTELATV